MRAFLPILIVLVGLAAVAVNVLGNVPRPFGEGVIDTRLGLDLQGGLRGEYRAVADPGEQVTIEALNDIRVIIENRINQYGVAEPIVQTQGRDRIVVELPGVQNEGQVRQLIGRTGRLEFVPIPPGGTPVLEGTELTNLPPCPSGTTAFSAPCVLFGGEELKTARPTFDEFRRPAVGFELKDLGARLFGEYTRANPGEQFAIVLDGSVVSAPEIQQAITGGEGIITSQSFTSAQVTSLVTILRYGALPLSLEEVSISRISPTLGLNFLQQSILAGGIGIALVFLFMLVLYRLPGAVACIALAYYALVVFAIFRIVPVTLTLAGVAAFVLSVGMAVDANILIFERTKEELRAGKTLFSAVEAGFNRAWNSIFDSNVSSILTAGILFYFGSPVIRGFALVLIIGVLISMFTAITLSRELMRWVIRQHWARRAEYFGVGEDEFTIAAPRTRTREADAGV